ncbi:MAG: chemotaxis protein, partial [Chitinophagaceae bacterium]|nr:chemotaxis protein [Chitinophagaceae bacterium]
MIKNMEINNPSSSILNQYVVGVGASAGGLEAINDFFDHIPADTGFSFIVVQHLSPDHRSLMGELLSKHTKMSVREAKDNEEAQPNCIYLIPSKKLITIVDGRLQLEDKVRDHQPNTAIDTFFESLARDKGEKAIGIILSGTGTDGSKGIRTIKLHGGMVVVQDPGSAQFDGMPNSAVASGYVDLILPPDQMGEELTEYVREAPLLRSFNQLTAQEEGILQDILELVLKTTGHDFSNYKRPTINRRVAKRMGEQNIHALPDYIAFLRNNDTEVKKLCRDFLLNVTRFFRDDEAFESVKTTVIPAILAKKQPGDIVKIWTVACSTGEEAYSLAILFQEAMETGFREIEVKIFASDISQDVIDFASRGVYSSDQVKNVSAERLKRFFTKEGNGYRVHASLRKMIVFAKHDIVKDPPFGRIDFVTCRNMLIYMNPQLQKSVLQKFHFSVVEDGYLMLGSSENIGVLKDVMAEVDKKWKIFKCMSKTKVAEIEAFSNPPNRSLSFVTTSSPLPKNALNNLAEIFKETLIEEFDFAGIFIDKEFEVKQAIGNFRNYMEFPESSFNFNLLKLVPTDLSIALSTSIRKAINSNTRVVQRNVQVKIGKLIRSITIIIKPYLVQRTYLQPFLFIVLKEEEIVKKKKRQKSTSYSQPDMMKFAELEEELRDTKENLQSLIEEVESANEELQSSNEEIVSSNEELQSTNEELQSLNEELHTVNAEHQQKIKELIELNDDLNNYFSTTEVGQIFVDQDLRIRKFTPVVAKQ